MNNHHGKFFIIYRKSGAGMFSDVLYVMYNVKKAVEHGMLPVVDMRMGHSKYNENKYINGSSNPWEYYFEQPGGCSLGEAYSSANIVMSSGNLEESSTFYFSDEAMTVYQKYLVFKKNIRHTVDEYVARNFTDRKILGVHFRGSDMIGAPEHYIPPDPLQMVTEVHKFLDDYPVDRIFLVTEVTEYAYLFSKMFSDKILLADEFRGTNTIDHYKIAYPRENHKYLLGHEIVINTILLSKTNYFLASGKDRIASGSNVSRTAQILNRNTYEAERYLYNGVYPSKRDG